jgi:hypothetical protein
VTEAAGFSNRAEMFRPDFPSGGAMSPTIINTLCVVLAKFHDR